MDLTAPEGWKPITETDVKAAKTVVRHAFETAPLECYYDVDGGFGGATFVGLGPNDPFDITASDLHAVYMLSVTIEPAATRRLLDDTEERQSLLDALRAVPPHLTLAEASNEELVTAWSLHEAAKVALAEPRAKNSNPWVTAAKLTARKRPLLIPVRDNLVSRAIGAETVKYGGMYWQIMRQLVSDPAVLKEASAAVAAAKERAATAHRRVTFETNILRLIDAAVWMTAAGHTTNPDGRCEPSSTGRAQTPDNDEGEGE